MTAYDIISQKRDGKALRKDQIEYFITGVTNKSIPDYQLAALLMAIYLQGMNDEEKHFLTQAMLNSGEIVDLSAISGIKVDKHSTGGVGDKVSIILAPIVAAAGVPVPMISGRGLGHTGGTLDKLQSIPGFRVDYDITEYKKIITEIGACLIGQTKNIAPADKIIYALRDVTATIQSIPLISGSIMSKKLAEGIDALVLDVKTGSGAFMQSYEKSVELAKSLIAIGEQAGKTTVAYITNMDQPLGNAVGNWLEIKECIDCLRGNGPKDLMELTHQLCGTMIWLGGKASSMKNGVKISADMISSSKAWEKFLEITKRQEGSVDMVKNPERYPRHKFEKDLLAPQNGYLASIDSLQVGLSAVALGAGRLKWEDEIDPKAGIILYKKVGDKVSKGEKMLTLYTDKKDSIPYVTERLTGALQFSEKAPVAQTLIYEYLDKSSLS